MNRRNRIRLIWRTALALYNAARPHDDIQRVSVVLVRAGKSFTDTDTPVVHIPIDKDHQL